MNDGFASPISDEPPSRRALPPFAALRAFDAVARLGGIRRAAQMLDVDHAVVSRHLRSLEAWTSTTLIDRSRTGTILTEDGARYHREIAPAIDGLARATMNLMKQSDNNRLQIWSMPGFAFQWLMARLQNFEAANPMLSVDLRPTDAPPDFGRHEADVDIRYAAVYAPPPLQASFVRTIEIAKPPVVPVASPEYLAAAPPIRTPADLLQHTHLHEEDTRNWRAWFEAHDIIVSDDKLAGPRLWHGHLTVDGARRGRGVALANHFLAADDLADGKLVDIGRSMDAYRPVVLGAYMFAARDDRWMSPPVVSCRRWLMAMVERDVG